MQAPQGQSHPVRLRAHPDGNVAENCERTISWVSKAWTLHNCWIIEAISLYSYPPPTVTDRTCITTFFIAIRFYYLFLWQLKNPFISFLNSAVKSEEEIVPLNIKSFPPHAFAGADASKHFWLPPSFPPPPAPCETSLLLLVRHPDDTDDTSSLTVALPIPTSFSLFPLYFFL